MNIIALKEIMREADLDDDGKVDYNEFHKIMNSGP